MDQPAPLARQAVALTEEQIVDVLATNKINPMHSARAIERAVWQANGITPA